MRKILVLFVIALSACSQATIKDTDPRVNRPQSEILPYVILVSIDAYRWDYTDLYSPKNLKNFRDSGTSAESLIPVYPSKTFTNHLSIATGLYAENHEIVSNHFYDPALKKEYYLKNKTASEDGAWYPAEPLWVTIEKQGLVTACYFWPGCQAEINGIRPKYTFSYNDQITPQERVDQVVQWLHLPEEKRPHFIAVYFSDVDSAGHKFGPGSAEVQAAIQRVDQVMGNLISEVEKSKLPIQLVVLSDHGMEPIDPEKFEYIDDYFPFAKESGVKVIGEGPQIQIWTDSKAKSEKIFKALNSKKKHFRIYKRAQLPQKLHYSKTPKAGDLVAIADDSYSIVLRSTQLSKNKGNHGYDADSSKEMHGIFYAKGSKITSANKIKSFRNIHIYPWILKLMGLKQTHPVDGESKVLDPILIQN
jgi:predicted AlkP superfamily pyrophosphatase or phosphodiesterase